MIEIDEAKLREILSVPAIAALRQIGEQESETIRSELSIPVEYDALGYVTVRSSPGEPPRKETGTLQMNVDFQINPDEPSLEIFASRPVTDVTGGGHARELSDPDAAIALEFGHGKVAARPFMGPAADRIAAYAVSVFADHYARMT